MAANNEDTTRADERAEETAGQAVTQTAADTAAGAVQPERTPASDDAADAPEEPSAPTLQVDPTDPFAVPANLIEVLRTETTSRQRSEDEDAGESEDRTEGAVVSRRRRRRRRGEVDMELDGGEAGDPEHTVTRVRAPRQAVGTAPDTVQSVKGSTRLEAKRQRRRDSRSGGRRRTVITEAEFLARREAVDRKMLVRQRDQRIQIAVLEDGVLAEHFVSHTTQDSMIGNVYLGKVQNVLPSMEAAFVDIGRGRNAVLYAGEVNWDAAQLDGKPRKIENALKSGDTVLVQVTKDPVGHKGARLTSQVSLPGRYLVYVPGGSMTGISRKLPDVERSRLKKILKDHLPQDAGVIVRTAAEGTSEQELQNDINRLRAQWEGIQEKASGTKVLAPELLYAEPDLTIKTVRDVFNEDFSAMLVQGEATWDNIEAYVTYVAPHLLDRLHHWVPEDHDGEDLYATHRVDEQLHKALERKVYLPSGGSLVIDRTEAMTVVDVNTGKFTGSGGNLEETVTKNNLEAAEEIVRQLRLRDIGGIIVVDFIDMVLESNRDLVLRRLVECLGRDRTKHQVAEVTSLGLVQMTRKRMGTGLLEVFSEPCEECAGRGVVVHDHPLKGRSTATAPDHRGGNRNERKRSRQKQNQPQDKPRSNNRGGADDQQQARDEAARTAFANIAAASSHEDDDAQGASRGGAEHKDSTGQHAEHGNQGPEQASEHGSADSESGRRRKKRRGKRSRGRGNQGEDTATENGGNGASEPRGEHAAGDAGSSLTIHGEVIELPQGQKDERAEQEALTLDSLSAAFSAEDSGEDASQDRTGSGRGSGRRGGEGSKGRGGRSAGQRGRGRGNGAASSDAEQTRSEQPEGSAPERDAQKQSPSEGGAGQPDPSRRATTAQPAASTTDAAPARRRRGSRRAVAPTAAPGAGSVETREYDAAERSATRFTAAAAPVGSASSDGQPTIVGVGVSARDITMTPKGD